MRRTITTIAVLASLALSAVPVFAACGGCCKVQPAAKHTAPRKVVSAVCPVMGTKIPDVTKASGKSVYKGKTYYFCCPGCKPLFDKNPGKYIKKK